MLSACPATEDFFRSRIDHMIDLRHPLAVLASRMPRQEIEARVAQVFSRKSRADVAMPELDLFGEQVQRESKPSKAGRPRVPLCTMIALLYLKHAFSESDEGVVERWADTPRWQFFSGCAYYEDRPPCDASTLVKFRQLLGEQGVEELLAQTINVAVDFKLIQPQELSRVIVDSTVQHKAIAHPTDSRLLETARARLVEVAKDAGVNLKQTFRSSVTSKPITAWSAATSRVSGATGCTRCCARRGITCNWLLRMIAKKGVTFLRRLYWRLCTVAGVSPNWQDGLGSLLMRALTRLAQRTAWAQS